MAHATLIARVDKYGEAAVGIQQAGVGLAGEAHKLVGGLDCAQHRHQKHGE